MRRPLFNLLPALPLPLPTLALAALGLAFASTRTCVREGAPGAN